ncbi:hypothetical protein PLICRDRAFT_354511 [Plicaturopsis crispa FD-325 SS-3]|uniref:Uncharacterized protein n=1 Tax=Plicaturopsis crispa FD-325 SS-3 TaxID=944288 RepID=A0A0C9SKZ8_PLICR|nr:hypothetical protein PLICRDRAFT_354511 [Plicaturopsis crispa FD-325 SS-3]
MTPSGGSSSGGMLPPPFDLGAAALSSTGGRRGWDGMKMYAGGTCEYCRLVRRAFVVCARTRFADFRTFAGTRRLAAQRCSPLVGEHVHSLGRVPPQRTLLLFGGRRRYSSRGVHFRRGPFSSRPPNLAPRPCLCKAAFPTTPTRWGTCPRVGRCFTRPPPRPRPPAGAQSLIFTIFVGSHGDFYFFRARLPAALATGGVHPHDAALVFWGPRVVAFGGEMGFSRTPTDFREICEIYFCSRARWA